MSELTINFCFPLVYFLITIFCLFKDFQREQRDLGDLIKCHHIQKKFFSKSRFRYRQLDMA